MKTTYLSLIFIIILLLIHPTVVGQDDYTALRKEIKKEKHDAKKTKIAQAYLDRAIRNSDTLNIANAYNSLALIKSNDKNAYVDSIIALTKNKNYYAYPAKGYLEKGIIKFELGDYASALKYYIKASEAAKKSRNDRLHLSAKFNIGLLRNMSGDREEAQAIFIEYVKFLEQNPKILNKYNYNPGLFALADSYIHTKDLNLAAITIDKGIKQTLKEKDSTVYSLVLVTSGIHQYLSKNYKKAIDSLQKGKKLIRQFDPLETRIASCDYYIGRSYKDLGEEEKSILYFKKVDTILRKTKDVIPEIIDVYEHLRAYAKTKK